MTTIAFDQSVDGTGSYTLTLPAGNGFPGGTVTDIPAPQGGVPDGYGTPDDIDAMQTAVDTLTGEPPLPSMPR